MEIKLLNGKFLLSGMFKGYKVRPGDETGESPNNHYQITLKNVETKKRLTYDYWMVGEYNPENNKKGLLDAYYSLLDDMCLYHTENGDMDSIFEKMGGGMSVSNFLKVHKIISNEYRRFKRVVNADDDIEKMLDLRVKIEEGRYDECL